MQASEWQPNILGTKRSQPYDAVEFGTEVVIIFPHDMRNIHKQLIGHPIPATKCLRVANRIGMMEIVSHMAGVSTDSISVFVGLALHRRPTSALRQ
jgi:hypothetical protein